MALHYRNSAAEAGQLAAELEQQRPGSTLLLQADLLQIAILPRLVEEVIERFGRLDALINNASSFYPTPLGSISEAQWDDLIGSNMKAPLFLSQAAAPHLKQSHGAIINLIDIYAERPLTRYPIYSAAKAGLAMLTKALARELGPEIRVNGVAPGLVMWPEGDQNLERQQRLIESSALKRAGAPEEIARTIRFLIFDASYVTGQILAVDGGRGLSLPDLISG